MTIKDPVCGMDVEVKDVTPKTFYNGKDYYFCCNGCLKSFEKDPDKYLAGDHGGHEHHHH